MSCKPPTCAPPPCPPSCQPPPCVPPSPPPCKPMCPPPPPPAPCRTKPIMKGLHWKQTTRVLTQAIGLSILAGASVYTFIGTPRRHAYADYYRKAEFEDQADEMARKGLFQAVPPESLKDNQDDSKKKC